MHNLLMYLHINVSYEVIVISDDAIINKIIDHNIYLLCDVSYVHSCDTYRVIPV